MSATTTPGISPLIFCADVSASLEFLIGAFGLTRGEVTIGENGTITHATATLGDTTVHLSPPHPGRMEPANNLPVLHSLLLVYVSDVDATYENARKAGATVEYPPQDMPYGQRECGLRDIDGHYWSFATRR